MQEQFTSEASPLQESQVAQNETPSRPHIWWWVGGGLLLILVVSASLYGYWRIASTAWIPEIAIELELSTVCCSSLPGEYMRDSEPVYILYPWTELSGPELESKIRAGLSSIVGASYERDEVLILLDGFDPNSFRIEGSYLVDNSGVYDQPLDVFGEILNGKMRYVGERDGVAVLQNERYKKSQVFVARTVERDLLTGQIEYLDYASTLERDVNGSVYQNGELTNIPDPESFVAIPVPNDSQTGYYKDKEHVYKVEGQEQILNVLEGVNKDSFEILESVTIPCQGSCEDAFPEAVYTYLKDKNNVYFENVMSGAIRIIRDADPVTFEVLDDKVYYDAQDKNYKYLKGEVVSTIKKSEYSPEGKNNAAYYDTEEEFLLDISPYSQRKMAATVSAFTGDRGFDGSVYFLASSTHATVYFRYPSGVEDPIVFIKSLNQAVSVADNIYLFEDALRNSYESYNKAEFKKICQVTARTSDNGTEYYRLAKVDDSYDDYLTDKYDARTAVFYCPTQMSYVTVDNLLFRVGYGGAKDAMQPKVSVDGVRLED